MKQSWQSECTSFESNLICISGVVRTSILNISSVSKDSGKRTQLPAYLGNDGQHSLRQLDTKHLFFFQQILKEQKSLMTMEDTYYACSHQPQLTAQFNRKCCISQKSAMNSPAEYTDFGHFAGSANQITHYKSLRHIRQ